MTSLHAFLVALFPGYLCLVLLVGCIGALALGKTDGRDRRHA